MKASPLQSTQLITLRKDGTWGLVSDDQRLLRLVNAPDSTAHENGALDPSQHHQQGQHGRHAAPVQVHAHTAPEAKDAHHTHDADLRHHRTPSAGTLQGQADPLPGAAGGPPGKAVKQYSHNAQGEELRHLLTDCPFLDVDSPVTSYEVFKMVVGLPWLAIKAVIAVIILMMVWGVTRVLIVGLPINQPMPFWRACIVRPFLQFWALLLLTVGLNFFSFKVHGWHHVAAAERLRAIICFNHVSYLDGIVIGSIFAPCGVAKFLCLTWWLTGSASVPCITAEASVADLPFFGTFTRALQFLFVERKGTTDMHNKHSVSGNTTLRIGKRAADPRYPLFIVAPEATTKHRHCLLKFSTGAFVSGQPVLPVLLRYKATHLNLGWGIVYTPWHFFRMCTQFVNHLEMDILEPYVPSEEERGSPASYANNVRELMASKLGAELSPHGITEQQACKRNGLHVDWLGRYVRQRPVHQRPALRNSNVKKTS